ncbi:MAG TPA: hypothetical protein PKD86_08425 [Gemmatales bacterium]|nr:hypothetical protein [Gemmatales bacterium]
MLKQLQPLFRRCRFEQLADVLPVLQEGAGIVADALDRGLPPGDFGQVGLDLPFFLFQPLQFRLDAGKPPRPKALEHLDQPADVGMDLGQPSAGQVFGFPQPVGFTAQARKRFLNDAVPCLDHPANRGDPPDDGVLQRFCRNAG